MEYWQTTEEIKKNYELMLEKRHEYGRLLRELIVQETCFKAEDIVIFTDADLTPYGCIKKEI